MTRQSLITIGGVVALVGALLAQSTPSFEVASVKPGAPSDGTTLIHFQPGGRVIFRNVPLRMIIAMAYQLRQEDERLTGGPAWIRTEKFTIEAKAAAGVTLGSFLRVGAPPAGLMMLRALLAERFQLMMHAETRELPIYALVTNADGRLGPKLTRSDVVCPPPGSPQPSDAAPVCTFYLFFNRVVFRNQPIAQLTDVLSERMGRLVVDRTGLAGLFDFEVTWTPDQPRPADAPDRLRLCGQDIDLTGGAPFDAAGPASGTALREQLGLRLLSTRGPVDVFVIDHVERPIPD